MTAVSVLLKTTMTVCLQENITVLRYKQRVCYFYRCSCYFSHSNCSPFVEKTSNYSICLTMPAFKRIFVDTGKYAPTRVMIS